MPTGDAPGWPKLDTEIHVVSATKIYRLCANSIFDLPMACAWINLRSKTCDIFVAEPIIDSNIEHEKSHCRGWGHYGPLNPADF